MLPFEEKNGCLFCSWLCASFSFFDLFFESCSLQVGNIGGKEFAESLAPDVQKLLVR